jgi:hypothetical protein
MIIKKKKIFSALYILYLNILFIPLGFYCFNDEKLTCALTYILCYILEELLKTKGSTGIIKLFLNLGSIGFICDIDFNRFSVYEFLIIFWPNIFIFSGYDWLGIDDIFLFFRCKFLPLCASKFLNLFSISGYSGYWLLSNFFLLCEILLPACDFSPPDSISPLFFVRKSCLF